MLKTILLVSIVLFLHACKKDEKISYKSKNTHEEFVQIEQDDESTEFSDSNLPLPVDDEAYNINEKHHINISIMNSLYKQKCATCHGEKAELTPQNSVAIKTLSTQEIIYKLQNLKDDWHAFLTEEQRENLAQFISEKNR